VALTIPALLAERIAAHGNEIVLRKKHRGIWQAVTWAELGMHVHAVCKGLAGIGLQSGDVACVLAETRPETAYADLGILEAGGVSGAINPASDADTVGELLRQSDCRALFVENEEQLDKVLQIRERCPKLHRIVIFDMKGLRDFADPMCESLANFVAREGGAALPTVTQEQKAVLLMPGMRVLTHGDAMHVIEHARSLLQPRARDERLALLPMCHTLERLGLYLSLDAGVISNYLESPDTVVENLQEVQPTLLGADVATWQLLYDRATKAADAATQLQRYLYRWAISSGGALAKLLVLNAVRRDLGLSKLRSAYTGAIALRPEIERWAGSLGIDIQRIDGQTTQGAVTDARYRALMEEAYSS
jgi:long-chain acyl-CoA synthetase